MLQVSKTMAPPTIKTAHLLLARVLEGNSPGLQIMLKQVSRSMLP